MKIKINDRRGYFIDGTLIQIVDKRLYVKISDGDVWNVSIDDLEKTDQTKAANFINPK